MVIITHFSFYIVTSQVVTLTPGCSHLQTGLEPAVFYSSCILGVNVVLGARLCFSSKLLQLMVGEILCTSG
jgi:hypothetical protein